MDLIPGQIVGEDALRTLSDGCENISTDRLRDYTGQLVLRESSQALLRSRRSRPWRSFPSNDLAEDPNAPLDDTAQAGRPSAGRLDQNSQQHYLLLFRPDLRGLQLFKPNKWQKP